MTVIAKEPITVPSGEDNLGTSLSTIRAYVAESADEAGIAKEAMHRLRLGVDEIAANILIHGYQEAGLEGVIKISAVIDDELLTISLEDTAVAYDPRTREAPKNLEDPLDTREIGGLGVYLTLVNIDVFDYERVDGKNINRFGMKRTTQPLAATTEHYHILLKCGVEHIQNEMRQALHGDEFELTIITDRSELVSTIQNQDCDIVLYHVESTESDEFDLLAGLKASTQVQVPIVIVSSTLDTELIMQAINAGADDYVPSPQSPALLKLRIQVNIERFQIQQKKMKNLVEVEDGIKQVLAVDPVLNASETDFNIDTFLHHVLAEIKEMYNADAGTVYFRRDDELHFIVVQTDSLGVTLGGLSNQPITFAPLQLYDGDKSKPNEHNIATYVALRGEAINIPDIYQAKRFDFSATKVFDAANHYKSISCLAVPLKDHHGNVIAVLQLLNAKDASGRIVPFDSAKQGITESLCNHVATILSNRLLIQQQFLTSKIEHDVQIGRQIQQTFLPTVFPQLPGWEISSYFHPAREVAGDFYDVFIMPGNRLGLVIADVCDKGVGAALFMSLMRSLLRAYALQHYSVDWSKLMDTAEVSIRKEKHLTTRKIMPSTGAQALSNAVQLTNDYVSKFHGELNMFATTFFGVLDPGSGSLLYINGGHCPPMLLDAEGNIKARLDATGPAVGMFPDSVFEMDEVRIEEGDTLFTFTDGVTDTRNEAGKMFKEGGILPLLQPPTNSVQALLERVKDNLVIFKGEAVQFDDITMLGIRREPRANS